MKTKVNYSSVRPVNGWRLKKEGLINGHFCRTYCKKDVTVIKDLTDIKIKSVKKQVED